MLNIFLASKTCVLILVLVSTGRVRAGTRMSEKQKEDGMKLLGSVFFYQHFRPEKWEHYQDPLADYYSKLAVDNLAIPTLGNLLSTAVTGAAFITGIYSDKLKGKGIEVTPLPDGIGWKLSFPIFMEIQNGIDHTIAKLFSSDNRQEVLDALVAKSVDLSGIVGFSLDWICDKNTDSKDNSTMDKKKKFSIVSTAKFKGVSESPKSGCRLFVVVTTCRSMTSKMYSTRNDDLTNSTAYFATRWANKVSLLPNFVTDTIKGKETFLLKRRRVSSEDLEALRTHMQHATTEKIKKLPNKQANVIMACAKVLILRNSQLNPTDGHVVVIGVEGLSEADIMDLNRELNSKAHNFQPYNTVPSIRGSCDFCQKSFLDLHEQSNLPLQCTDCGLVVHALCSTTAPKGVGVVLNAVGEGNLACILRNCIALVEENGVTTEGIYRLSGPKLDADNLIYEFENGMCMSKDRIWKYSNENVHTICMLVKKFLRDLSPMLISLDIFTSLKTGWNHESGPQAVADNVTLLNRWLNVLPRSHKIILKFVLQHLVTLSTNYSETTRMGASNLSIVFAPKITDIGLPISVMFGDNTKMNNTIFEAMIQNFRTLDIANLTNV